MTKRSGKLLSLKEWLTLEDAAKHLSLIFDEAVTVADVLRLALDKRLVLSVRFVNHTQAKRGVLVPFKQCKFTLFPSLESFKKDAPRPPIIRGLSLDEIQNPSPEVKAKVEAGELIPMPSALHVGDDQWLVLEDGVKSISEIWDLPMIGGEKLDVEHFYQMETDGPEITLSTLDGAFVTRGNVYCQLLEDYDDNQYQAGSKASLERLKMHISEKGIAGDKANELLAEHQDARKKFQDDREAAPYSDRFYPAGKLPSDSVFVVRTSALRELELSLFEAPTTESSNLSQREEVTYLNIVAGLLHLMRGKTPGGKARSVYASESAIISGLLAEFEGKQGITKRTLEEKFAAAKRNLQQS